MIRLSKSRKIKAFDETGFSVAYQHEVVGWEASKTLNSATLFLSANRRLSVTATRIVFEDATSGSTLAEWDLWDEEAEGATHAELREALHAAAAAAAAEEVPAELPPLAAASGEEQQTASLLQASAAADGGGPLLPSRRLGAELQTSLLPAGRLLANQIPASLHGAASISPQQEREYARLLTATANAAW
ncbi:hypothetical protein Efla_006390 [Eimeria flavescens]